VPATITSIRNIFSLIGEP
jgi:cryptochrome